MLNAILKTFTFALSYFFLAQWGNFSDAVLIHPHGVCLASGLALAGLLLMGLHYWPAVLLASLSVFYFEDLPVITSITMAVGHTLQAVIGAYLCRSAPRFNIALTNLNSITTLLVGGAFASASVGASLDTLASYWGGLITIEEIWPALQLAWVGYVSGVLIVTPLVLIFFAPFGSYKLAWSVRRLLEAAVLTSSLVFVLLLNFYYEPGQGPRLVRSYFLFPFLTWCSLRFRQPGAALAIIVVSVVAVWSTLSGYGAFSGGSTSQNSLHLLAFLVATSLTSLFTAALSADRERERLNLRATQLANDELAESSRLELEKRVEERTAELKKSEQRFRAIIEAVRDYAIFMLDPRGHVMTWNSGAEKITGYQAYEIIGQHFSIFYPKDIGDYPEMELRSAIEDGRFEDEGIRVRKDGTTYWSNVIITPLFDVDGTLAGFSKVTRDITEKRRQAQLKQEKEAAEAASAAKSSFLATMSHEIRTPLGAVLGFAELLGNPELSNSERLNSVEAIKRNGKILSNLINDILDLSKVEAGKLDVERVDVAFSEIITDIETLLNLEATAKGITLTLTSEDIIPVYVQTDPLRLRQILINIIGNAIKFTTKGSVDVRVKLVQSADGQRKLAFIVKDTGPGISTEQVEKLFTPFGQADISITRRFGGTGLGLILSRKLAKLLGGDVQLVESQMGVGSTFMITIDPGVPDRVLFSNYVSTRKPALPKPKLVKENPIRVLLIEDSPDNQMLISRHLRLAGVNVDTADNGKIGYEKALKGRYDVVLMDIQMPEMDGYEATKRLRSQGYSQPIIALTAYAMKDDRKRCLENGFNDHIGKPIDKDELLKTISQYTS